MKLRQAAAELLACAVMRTFPKAQIVRAEASEEGFSLDFNYDEQIDSFALKMLHEQMMHLSRENPEGKISEMMRENAKGFLRHKKQHYLAEQAGDWDYNTLLLITWNDFTDIYRGAVVPFSEVEYFKLLSAVKQKTFISGKGEVSVWHIEGVVFETLQELKTYSKKKDKGVEGDHRLVGREMELFVPAEESSHGSFLWLPRGKALLDQFYSYWQGAIARYRATEVSSPSAIAIEILDKRAPYLKARELPFFSFESTDYFPFPPVAPFHAEMFASRTLSYKELPYRVGEWKQNFNFLPAHRTKGLLHSRTQLQDVTHTFCQESEVVKELKSLLQSIIELSKILGYEYRWFLSSKGEKSAGTQDNWNKGNEWLRSALAHFGETAQLTPEIVDSDGPALYLCARDHLQREWLHSSVGINLNLPRRMGLRYQGNDNNIHLPWMLFGRLFHSVERTIGLLLEKDHGWLPLWIAPEQVRIIPVTEEQQEQVLEIEKALLAKNFRTFVDLRHEKLGAKLRAADRAKVPVVLLIGNPKEQHLEVVVRRRGREEALPLAQFSELVNLLVEERDSKRSVQPFEE